MARREVSKHKTRQALRKLARAAKRAADEGAPGLTAWEQDFLEGVTGRLEAYGSAFRDPSKGALEEALSQRQAAIARALDAKSRKRKRALDLDDRKPALRGSTLKRKTPLRPRAPMAASHKNRPAMPVIEGGKPPASPRGKRR